MPNPKLKTLEEIQKEFDNNLGKIRSTYANEDFVREKMLEFITLAFNAGKQAMREEMKKEIKELKEKAWKYDDLCK